jgi:hypothetical protein
MNPGRAALTWLALAGLVGDALAAGPRDPPANYVTPPPETAEQRRARRVAQMDAALRRLTGRFRVEYPWVLASPRPTNMPRTVVDCVFIGEGPGLYCIHYVARPQQARGGQPAAGSTQQTSGRQLRAEVFTVSRIVEYGIDPNASRIRAMTVTPGDALRMAGIVGSETLTVWGRCWDSEFTCAERLTFTAGSEDLWLTAYANWNRGASYALRRLADDDTDPANWPLTGLPPTFPKPKPGPR